MTISKQEANELLADARRVFHGGKMDEGCAMLAREAARARADGTLNAAITLTLGESLMVGQRGDPQLALARATWCLSAAMAEENRLALQRDAWDVTLSFLLFSSHAKRNASIPFEGLLDVLDRAVAFVEGANQPTYRAGVLSERAAVLAHMGRYDEAIAALEEALSIKTQFPQSPGHTASSMKRSLGSALAHAGRRAEAARLFAEMLEDPHLKPLDRLAAATYGARNLLEMNVLDEAARLADEARRIAVPLGPNQVLSANGTAVEVYLAVGRLEDAAQAAEQVRTQAAILGSHNAIYCAHEDTARVALARRDEATFRREMAALRPLAEKHDQRAGHREYSDRLDALLREWDEAR